MKIICSIKLDYKNRKESVKIFRSIKVDDLDFVESELDGNQIKATIESKSVSSLIHTLDDYLACLSVAENIVNEAR